MLEVLALASATTGLVLFSRRRAQMPLHLTSREEGDEDLPCPWCLSPTQAADAHCPSCGRRFG